jgi:hypothetical protein
MRPANANANSNRNGKTSKFNPNKNMSNNNNSNSSLQQPNSHFADCILLAEFNIDKGATLTFQYPHSTGTDERYFLSLSLSLTPLSL